MFSLVDFAWFTRQYKLNTILWQNILNHVMTLLLLQHCFMHTFSGWESPGNWINALQTRSIHLHIGVYLYISSHSYFVWYILWISVYCCHGMAFRNKLVMHIECRGWWVTSATKDLQFFLYIQVLVSVRDSYNMLWDGKVNTFPLWIPNIFESLVSFSHRSPLILYDYCTLIWSLH